MQEEATASENPPSFCFMILFPTLLFFMYVASLIS